MLMPFSPPPGLNSDDTAFAAEGRWADGNNVRFYNGKPQTIGGRSEQFTIPVSNGRCRAIMPFVRSGNVTIAYGLATVGTAAKLYVGSGLAAPADRTPAGLTNNEPNWSLATWGDTLLACPSGGTLYEQSGTSTATAVTQAPDAITYMLVTAQRQVLALGCNEEGSGTFNGLCIRGCDLEDYTDWTTSATNNAFEHILDGVTAIVAGRLIGDYVAVWTSDALYLGQFVGDPSQTFRFDRVSEGCGLAGPHAVVVVDMVAYWMGPDMIPRRWSPGGLPETIPSPIGIELRTNASFAAGDIRYLCASHNRKHNEIRFDYVDARGGFGSPNTRFVAVSLIDGSWHKGIGARSAMVDSQTIASLVNLTKSSVISCLASTSASGDNSIAIEDTGNFSASSALCDPYIQSADLYLDDSQRRVMIRGALPDFESQANDVALTLFVRDRPQSSATTKGPYALTTATTKKDFRVSGKIVAVKLGIGSDGVTAGNYFRLGKLLFDIVPLGER